MDRFNPGGGLAASFEYRRGELVDVHDRSGKRHFDLLNPPRKARGLTELNARDFADEVPSQPERE